MDSDLASQEEKEGIPEEIMEAATKAKYDILPEKAKARYEKRYKMPRGLKVYRRDCDEDDTEFDMLHNLHTGHYWYGLKSQENSSSSSEDEAENIPHPLCLKDLERNLVVVDDLGQVRPYNPSSTGRVAYFGATSHQTPKSNELQKQEVETSARTIADKLTTLITKDNCYVCKLNIITCNKHYHKPGHYIKVREWIERELTKVKEPVEQKLIFCQVCNLPLSGNEKALLHYLEKKHKKKQESFCTVCLRMIDAADMTSHKQSRQHLKKLEALQNDAAKKTLLQIENAATKSVSAKETYKNEIDGLKNETIETSEYDNELYVGVDTSDASEIHPLVFSMEVPCENGTSNEQPVLSVLNIENKEETIKDFNEAKLTNSELQRLVMLEQLELLRLMMEKELIILDRLRSQTTQKV